MQEITKIYMGKDRVCRCGCAGNYYTKDDPVFPALVERFQKAWKRYEKAGKVKEHDKYDGDYYNISYAGNKAMTAYFGD